MTNEPLNLAQAADVLADVCPMVERSENPAALVRVWRSRGHLPDPALKVGKLPYWSAAQLLAWHADHCPTRQCTRQREKAAR